MTELNRLLQRLCDAEIDFVIVGGYAAMLHGSSMLTRDLDVCALLTGENVARLRAVFRDLRPTHRHHPGRLSFLDHPDPGVPLRNVYLQTDLGPVDVMTSITGVGGFEEVRRSAIRIEIFGRFVHVIDLRNLIRAKEALGREKDLISAKELRAIASMPGHDD
ncbi:MAG: nucleotidyltransferase [Gammaproteobacteria bacterium]